MAERKEILDPPSKDRLVGIWTHQFIRQDDLGPRALSSPHSNRVFITDERMAVMMNEAFTAGWRQGELQGRANLRTAIENGTIEPITRVEGGDGGA